MLAHCPASAPRARTSRRACLASTDAPRRDAQNLPRRISPRDGSREHEPRTCAIAQRFLRVPHRSTYAYACTRTRPRSRRPDDSPEEQERRRARRHAARPVTGGRAAVTEAGRPVAARPRKSKVVPMAASGRGYVLGASGEITCRRALRQAVRPTTGGRIWRWRGGRPILAGRPRPIFCAVHACMNAHAGATRPRRSHFVARCGKRCAQPRATEHDVGGAAARRGPARDILRHACMHGKGRLRRLRAGPRACAWPPPGDAVGISCWFETAPGSQTGSGYEQLGSNFGLGSEVCS